MPSALTPSLAAFEGALKVFGGLRAAAFAADVDPSNLSRFIRHGVGLSADSVQRLEAILGRENGRLTHNTVHVIRPKKYNIDFLNALRWYFPEGAEVARATWSGLNWEHTLRFFKLDFSPEIYAIRSHQSERLVVLGPAGLLIPRKFFGAVCPDIRWRGGEPERAELQFDDVGPWFRGEIDVDTFDAAWPELFFDPTFQDLLDEVRRLNISWAEAIRRLHLQE